LTAEERIAIAILGAGAMGSLFGARLVLAGHSVTLVDPDESHIETVREYGLLLRSGSDEARIELDAVLHPNEAAAAEIVIVLTKANNLLTALESAERLLETSPLVVVLCNGLGCADVAGERVAAPRLLYGVTAAGAVLDDAGVVRETVEGPTYLGWRQPSLQQEAHKLARLLASAGLPADAVEDIEGRVWTKALINIGYNAATALARVRNGDLVGHEAGRAVIESAVREAVAVAAARGTRLYADDPVGEVTALGELIGPNRSSMLQDVMRSRETEIEFLNGAIVREGRRLGVPTPTNEILADLVRTLQDHYGSSD